IDLRTTEQHGSPVSALRSPDDPTRTAGRNGYADHPQDCVGLFLQRYFALLRGPLELVGERGRSRVRTQALVYGPFGRHTHRRLGIIDPAHVIEDGQARLLAVPSGEARAQRLILAFLVTR